MDLVVAIYHATKNLPKEEMYGLTSQLRRAAVSVPSNIAEGASDRTMQQFSDFLSNAIGSLNEIDTQLDVALRLGYLAKNAYHHLHENLDDCLALTYGLRKSLGNKNSKQQAASSKQQAQDYGSQLTVFCSQLTAYF